MLYTVVPLEQIYTRRTKVDTAKSLEVEKEIEFKDVLLEHGLIHARREKDHYVVDSIHSTNMEDYLDEKYAPGSVMDV